MKKRANPKVASDWMHCFRGVLEGKSVACLLACSSVRVYKPRSDSRAGRQKTLPKIIIKNKKKIYFGKKIAALDTKSFRRESPDLSRTMIR